MVFFLLSCQQDQNDTAILDKQSENTEEDNTEEAIDESDDTIADLDSSLLQQGNNPCKEPQLVRVNRVVDGDTIYVVMGPREEKIRLIGINTPEIGYDGEVSECFAEEARQYLESLVKGMQLWITFDETCQDTYGRWLGYAHLGLEEDDFVQRHLLQNGYGKAFPFDDTPTFNALFVEDEHFAEQNQLGGWAICSW